MSVNKYIAKVRKEFSEIKKTYEIFGSTYSLIVDITEMTIDLLHIVQKAHGTEYYNKAKKLLRWKPKTKFKDLVRIMVEEDIKRWKKFLDKEPQPWDLIQY